MIDYKNISTIKPASSRLTKKDIPQLLAELATLCATLLLIAVFVVLAVVVTNTPPPAQKADDGGTHKTTTTEVAR